MVTFLAALCLNNRGPVLPIDTVVDGFRRVPNESKMRMYWRIFGPAWTAPEMDYQLDEMKAAGIGGLTAYFMYPFAQDDPAKGIKNLKFGSPEFLDSLKYATEAAKQRDLSFGLNGSTGWPFGGPTVSVADSAQMIREVLLPARKGIESLNLKDDETIVACFQDGKRLFPNQISMGRPSKFYVSGPTRMQVKRAAFGSEGLVVNHYDKSALDHYLAQVVEPMLKASHGIIENLGCDSLEVYRGNWTNDLPKEFLRRKGYDLVDHFPELFDEKSEAGKQARFDFWQVLAELTEERFTKPLGDWCAKRNLKLEMEPYGTPPNPMTSSRYIQTPTGEHYEWKGFSVQKYVASAAHQAGRNIVSSEAWTWAGLPNRMADSLSDLKLVTDMTFLSGSNDLMAVDFPYSPRSAGSPGWIPYYGPFMGPGNSQWPMFPALSAYINRCQWMLRQGEPVRDVLVYLPVEDSFRDGPTEQMTLDFYVRDRLVTGKATSEFGLANGLKHQSDLIHGLICGGFDYDGVDFWSINRRGAVEGATLRVGSAKYKAVVLPNLETINAAALAKIIQFCRSGGTVVATRSLPTKTPGFARQTNAVNSMIEELFGRSPVDGVQRKVGNGTAIWVKDDWSVAGSVAKQVKPSVSYSSAPRTIGFQHRRVAGREIFFFSNVGPKPVQLDFKLNIKANHIEKWDALTGEMVAMPDGPNVYLELPPRGSQFIVVGRVTDKLSPPARPISAYTRTELSKPWTLTFEGPDAPPSRSLTRPVDWSLFPASKFFSGIGHYSTTLKQNVNGFTHYLELGDVREAATVKVNGINCGTVIVPPFEVDITNALRNGVNTIDIAVANLSVNRFIGLPKVDMEPLRKIYGNRFQYPEEYDIMKGVPAPSGFMGPVYLRVKQ